MESPQPISPNPPFGSAASSRSRSSSKLDDVASLTSFNPFSEEDENDQSSYAIVSSLFSKVKNTFSAPLSAAAAAAAATTLTPPPTNQSSTPSQSTTEARRPSIPHSISNNSTKIVPDRPSPLNVNQSKAAPPLVSLTPVTSETPSYVDFERSNSQGGSYYTNDAPDGALYGTYIPGFPMADSDARSIRTTASTNIKRSASVSKVIRRIRGEGAPSPRYA